MRTFLFHFIVLLLAGLVGCKGGKPQFPQGGGEEEAAPTVPRVRAAVVEKDNLTRTIEMPGSVEGYETADLYAKVGGYLKEIYVDIGDRVEKGQKLAVLDIPEMAKVILRKEAGVEQAQAELLQAEAAINQAIAEGKSAEAALKEAQSEESTKQAQVKYAQVNYNRVRGLVEGGGARREKLDEARLQLEKAQSDMTTVKARIRTAEAMVSAQAAKVDKALADYNSAAASVTAAQRALEEQETLAEYATIKAPFKGVITRRWLHPGAFVQPAERNSAAKPLLTVTRTDKLRIFVSLPMSEIRWLDLEDEATLEIEALQEKLDAKVSRFSPALDQSTRTMKVELALKKPDDRLFPGSYVYARLNLVSYNNVPIIPASSLMTDEDSKFVYVIENNRIKKQEVQTIYEDGEKVAIEQGLGGGETVVETGGGQLAPGQEVKPELQNGNE